MQHDKFTGTRYKEDFRRQIVNRILSGETILAVSRETRISQPSINRWLKEFNLENPNARINNNQVDKTELEELRKQVKTLTSYITKLERHIISLVIKDQPGFTLDRVKSMYDDEKQH